jgi:hypothetical protein
MYDLSPQCDPKRTLLRRSHLSRFLGGVGCQGPWKPFVTPPEVTKPAAKIFVTPREDRDNRGSLVRSHASQVDQFTPCRSGHQIE